MTIPPKTEAAKFRRAAELILTGAFRNACPALKWAMPYVDESTPKSLVDFFGGLFRPRNQMKIDVWWKYGEREPRAIALLLAAQIIEEGKF